MGQIVRRDGIYYYEGQKCHNVDEAYGRFRADYHAELGRDSSRRLDRLGARTERIHGFGFDRKDPIENGCEFNEASKVPYRMLGLIGISYCRILGIWDVPDLTDEQFDEWFEWAFTKGSKALRLIGKAQKTGRTAKGFRKRYR